MQHISGLTACLINKERGRSATVKNKTKNFRKMNHLDEYIIYGWTKYSAQNKVAKEGKQHSSGVVFCAIRFLSKESRLFFYRTTCLISE
jgi:hypothetical protein